jgi:GxxExxY protein
MTKLIYPELSYKVVGLIYKIYNDLGYGYQEKYYQRALTLEFEAKNVSYKKEIPFKICFKNKIIGRYHLDFLIEDKIALEIKVANNFYPRHFKQVLSHLRATGLKLGLLAIFKKDGVEIKRVVN